MHLSRSLLVRHDPTEWLGIYLAKVVIVLLFLLVSVPVISALASVAGFFAFVACLGIIGYTGVLTYTFFRR